MELQNLKVGPGLSMSLTQLFGHIVSSSCPSQLVAFRSEHLLLNAEWEGVASVECKPLLLCLPAL